MKLTKIAFVFLLVNPVLSILSQVHLSEGFESSSRPVGWTEETVSGNEPWRFRNGGHSPNDNNWQVPPEQVDITRNPPAAYEGTFNAIFFKQGNDNERTKLITPEMDLLGAASLELSFFLCQIPWTFEGSTGWDVLRVYYKTSPEGEWGLLREYLDPVQDWEEQKLVLPNPSSTYYVAFEGHTRWGYGTCIDNITVQETGSQPLYLGEIDFKQPFTNSIPSGSPDVPVLRIDVKVFGNTDSAMLNHVEVTSLNTSDSDLMANGVKLYSTTTQTFSTDHPLGSPTNFVSGIASFSGLNYSLPSGQSYLWLTCDIDINATHGNVLDVMVASDGIMVNDTLYPVTDQSPIGEITIYETRYFQDFEGSHGWALTGEFEVDTPTGLGGALGNPDPSEAYSGTKVLGTDLTGLGSNPYQYESGLNQASNYLATSTTIDVFYYKNVNLFFRRHMNIEVWDQASIEVSTDDGSTWNTFWESNSYLSDFQWMKEIIPIPDEYARTDMLKIRYKLGPTDGFNNYTGWNIDDIYLTGEFISKDVGVSEWIYPLSGSGHTSNDSVTVRIANYGGAEIIDPVPVAYSFDGGNTWTIDQISENIPVGGSVVFTFSGIANLSEPGLRPAVLAKTALPGDQFSENDQITTELYIVPTYVPPYLEDFESGEGYWRSIGKGIWEYGNPAGSTINGASSGNSSWVTGLSHDYGDLIADKTEIVFDEDFETDLGWAYNGEFERAIPSNISIPYFASSGYYCIGTDLSGRGTTPYNYENGISTGTAYTAISPAIDVSNFSNLVVSYSSWITIQNGDSIKLEVSPDNGSNWHTLWKNSEGAITETDFQLREYPIDNSLSYTNQMRFRFSMFYSSPSGPVSEGWNIDDFILIGDLVDSDPGYLSSPSYDLTGLANPVFEARLWVESEQDVDGATLYYSTNDGNNWTAVSNSSGYDSYWNWYTGNPVEALGLNGWSGQTVAWVTARHLLPAVLHNQANVQFRFEFKADKVDNQYDGIAVDDVRILEAPKDIDLLAILNPLSSCELSSNQAFTLRIRNAGLTTLQPGDSLRVGYYIDRNGEIQMAEETFILTQSLSVGATRDLNMSSLFDFSTSGDYLTEVFIMTADPHFFQAISNDTVSQNIQVKKPYVDFGEDISTVRPDTVILRAYSGAGGQTYLWQDSSTDSLYNVNTDGTYYVRVTNGIGCIASDTIQVLQLIADVGVGTVVGPLSDCELGDQLPIEITIQNFGTDTLEVGGTLYVSGEINQINQFADTIVLTQRFKPGEIINFTYSGNFDFSVPGKYEMKLFTRLAEDVNIDNDTLFHTLEVYGYPDSDLGPDTIALSSEYILTPAPGYAEYLWQDGSAAETFTVSEPGLGLYHVTVSDVNQCISADTVIVTLNVMDMALDELLAPATSCELSESITVSARIRNAGNQTIPSGETINMAYFINGGSFEQEAFLLTKDLLSGHTIDFVFSKTENVLTGQWYDFTVFVDYSNDSKSMNDTILQSVGVFEAPSLDLGGEFQVITEINYTLDAGPGFVSYEWQDGSTDQTFTISEPGIGVYGVTVVNENGCSVYDETEILLVVPDIGLGELTHPQTTCRLEASEHVQVAVRNFGNWDIEPGASIWVAYSINGGDAVVENVVMDNTFENGTVILHTFAQVEDFSEPGRYEIMAYTVYASDLIPSNNIILVNVDHFGSPQIDIGNGEDTILVYEPITLSAAPGYPSYLWQDGNTNLDYRISTPSEGIYSVAVTGDNACVTLDSVYVAYDVPDLEVTRIVSPVSSCGLEQDNPVSIEILNKGYYRVSTEDTITITYSVNGASSVVEAIHLDSALPPGQSKVIYFASGYDFSAVGNYRIQVSVLWSSDENLSNNILTSDVTVYDAIEVEIGGGLDIIKTGLPITLDAGSGFVSYLWQDNSTATTFEVTEFGLYWIMVTDDNGCRDHDSVYVDSETSAEEWVIMPGQVRIFPNPVKEVLNVALELDVEREVTLELYTIANSLVYREDIKRALQTEAHIDVQGLTSGTYFLRVTADDIPHNFLVIVE